MSASADDSQVSWWQLQKEMSMRYFFAKRKSILVAETNSLRSLRTTNVPIVMLYHVYGWHGDAHCSFGFACVC